MKEQMKMMKQNLMSCVQSQMSHLDDVDTKELGEAIDMIKDLSEAIYYCTITEAMEDKDKEKENSLYEMIARQQNQSYREPVSNNTYYYTEYKDERERDPYYRDMDRYSDHRMYYSSSSSGGNGSGHSSSDSGNSSSSSNNGSSSNSSPSNSSRYHSHNMKQNWEEYMKEFSEDMNEVIQEATPEEKKRMAAKLSSLIVKLQNENK